MVKERQARFLLTLFILLALVALGGCGREAPAPSPSAPSAPVATPAPSTPAGTAGVPAPAPAAGIALEVKEPKDESILSSSPARVSGVTALDAIVSVNGNIVEVGDNGTFNTSVNLLEGPNLLEVTASDYQGNRVSRTITVIYLP